MFTEIQAEIKNLEAILTILGGLYATEHDVHTHTRTFGKYFKTFQALDQKYAFSNLDKPLKTVIEEIQRECPTDEKTATTGILNNIRANSSIEPETQTDVQQLLIRTWSLAKDPLIDDAELVMYNLYQNTVSGGGCIAGIAGRLIQNYAVYVFRLLQRKHSDMELETTLKRSQEDSHPKILFLPTFNLSISDDEIIPPVKHSSEKVSLE